ncbi:MAG TPA: ABC transporter ATP-binding protein [Lacipirellulaceae bacterium]|jgi:ABC-2 type transport system ATP-binding protein|nr:ABC transporter ATP-binding protein [Lacipirellulaceae bacterium]
MIDVHDLRKSFGATVAVAGVSFEVRAGETFGLLGPNGAGKSTTIAMLTGALAPDAGSIRLAGLGAPNEARTRMRIGVAPQSLSLYEELTTAENLKFFGRLYDLTGAALAERVDWALEFAGLTDRRKDRVKTFSGGMKRRLNLAVALVHNPQVIFLDEPTAGVDPQSRNHIFERIERLRGEGRTVVYTTHYMEEAQRLCERVAIMDHGKILDLDTIPALLSRYGGRSVVKGELVRPPVNGVKLPAALDGLALRFESEQPLQEIARLSSEGVAFRTLEVAQPDLETVFLSLTGRSLRD